MALEFMPLDPTVEAIQGYHAYWSTSKTELYRILRTPIESPCQDGASMTKTDRWANFSNLYRRQGVEPCPILSRIFDILASQIYSA